MHLRKLRRVLEYLHGQARVDRVSWQSYKWLKARYTRLVEDHREGVRVHHLDTHLGKHLGTHLTRK